MADEVSPAHPRRSRERVFNRLPAEPADQGRPKWRSTLTIAFVQSLASLIP